MRKLWYDVTTVSQYLTPIIYVFLDKETSNIHSTCLANSLVGTKIIPLRNRKYDFCIDSRYYLGLLFCRI